MRVKWNHSHASMPATVCNE